ncbi:MAG: hypothetical protein ACTSPM_14500 [Candidatus Heimdallarchaeota archaeon]
MAIIEDVDNMTSDYFREASIETKTKNKKNHQRLFVMKGITDIECKLPENQQNYQSHTARCEKCGFPIHIKPSRYRTSNNESTQTLNLLGDLENVECSICKRTRILNIVLVTSYIVSAAIFILLIIGVIFDFAELDVSLMIGCLEIIFLLFFGRFLEEAVFFGFSKEKKLLAALYRFSESGEIQALDIALKYIKSYNKDAISDELFQGILHIQTFQPLTIPYDFENEITQYLKLSRTGLEHKLSSVIDDQNEIPYLKRMIQKIPPAGITALLVLSLKTNNELALSEIFSRLKIELEKETIDPEIIKEFFISQEIYEKAYSLNDDDETLKMINELASNFKAPKVPSLDVVGSSRKIMQNPLMRYAIRILMFIGLAFLLGLLYQLLK